MALSFGSQHMDKINFVISSISIVYVYRKFDVNQSNGKTMFSCSVNRFSTHNINTQGEAFIFLLCKLCHTQGEGHH